MSEGFSNPVSNAVGTLVRQALQSFGFVSGSTGWMIARAGNAEFNNVTVRGNVTSSHGFFQGPAGTDPLKVGDVAQPDFTLLVHTTGRLYWGPGDGTFDSILRRSAVQRLLVDQTNLTVGGPAADDALSVIQTNDVNPRIEMSNQGNGIQFGDGTNAPDVTIKRFAAGRVQLGTDNALDFFASVAGNTVVRHTVQGEANARLVQHLDGRFIWGPGGASTQDTALYRNAASRLGTDSNFSIDTAGKTLMVKEGSNACMGIATLVAGQVVVNTTAVQSNSRIFLTNQDGLGTTGAVYVNARTAGVSFTIKSTSATDTADIAWMIVNPA